LVARPLEGIAHLVSAPRPRLRGGASGERITGRPTDPDENPGAPARTKRPRRTGAP
jgi:hypothetical protein